MFGARAEVPTGESHKQEVGEPAGNGPKVARLAILLGAPLTDRHFERLGITRLASCCDVVVIDCMRLAGRDPSHVTSQMAHWPHYAIVNSAQELHQALALHKPDYALDDIGISPETAFVGEIVRSHGTKLVCVRQGRLPKPAILDRLRTLIFARSKAGRSSSSDIDLPAQGADHGRNRGALGGALGTLVARGRYEYRRRVHMPSPDVALIAGTRSLDWYAKRAAQRIWIASDDYHTFRRVASEVTSGALRARSGRFAVFVDVCLPLAADWKLLNVEPPIGADEYYPKLRVLLDRVEQISGMSVVVAGHPNSRAVPDYANLVGGRELVFGQTAALVMQAELVLSHASTATSFIALAQKRALFVSSRSIDATAYGAFVRAMARSLDRPTVMLDNVEQLEAEMLTRPASEKASASYVERYLRSQDATEDRPWQEFIDFLQAQHR